MFNKGYIIASGTLVQTKQGKSRCYHKGGAGASNLSLEKFLD
jgi:hypothetical protein